MSNNVKLYLAGPLFTSAEIAFNAQLAVELRAMQLDVLLPQENEFLCKRPSEIFAADVKQIEDASIVVANMSGPDPDSGTCWEVGYAYAKQKQIILFRSDLRTGSATFGTSVNLMMTESSSILIEMTAEKMLGPNAIKELANQIYVACVRVS
jgi:nucleoside 2-deoxyribosyltransferase